jgi:hypothetical protein
MTPLSFLDDLDAAARRAEAAEATYRREAAQRIAALETARAFAFRRLNWMKMVADAIAAAEDEDNAVAHARAALQSRLGWNEADEAHEDVLGRFAPVARAIYVALMPTDSEESKDVQAALATFESWYQQTYGRSFWVLFEHYISETPLVDF